MKEKRQIKEPRRGLKVALAIIGGFLGGFLIVTGGFLAYRKGIEVGREEMRQEEKAKVGELAEAIAEKSELSERLDELTGVIPSTFTSENVEEYRQKLAELRDAVANEEVKTKLDELIEEVKEFGETFQGRDNAEIETELAELKEKASETSQGVRESLDRRIKTATEALAF